jgi:hypothetical protein
MRSARSRLPQSPMLPWIKKADDMTRRILRVKASSPLKEAFDRADPFIDDPLRRVATRHAGNRTLCPEPSVAHISDGRDENYRGCP